MALPCRLRSLFGNHAFGMADRCSNPWLHLGAPEMVDVPFGVPLKPTNKDTLKKDRPDRPIWDLQQ